MDDKNPATLKIAESCKAFSLVNIITRELFPALELNFFQLCNKKKFRETILCISWIFDKCDSAKLKAFYRSKVLQNRLLS